MAQPRRDASAYLRELTSRLRAVLGDHLVGVYAGGSYALGDYEPGRSDLDVAVVCRGALSRARKERIAAALSQESLPCPARGLELVVYRDETVRSGTVEPGYELNLNTGQSMPFVVSFAPEGETHWYAVDRAVVREHGVALAGPPPAQLFAPIAPAALLERVIESIRWYAANRWAGADDAVLNACRAWRYACERAWSSKAAAGRWALERTGDPSLVEDALAARRGGVALARERADAFLDDVLRRLENAHADASLHS